MTFRVLLGALCLLAPLGASTPVGAAPPRAYSTGGTQARVQVGYCGALADLEVAKAAGFDYVELRTSEFAGLTDEQFEQAFARAKQIGMPTPVSNLFLPGSLKVTGPQTDAAQQTAYVTKALARAARLGITTIVFGSGGARNVPDGFSKAAAFQQLVEFGRRIAPLARERGITIAIEPLRRQESNIINTAREGLALVDAIADPNFQLMVDFYHLASEKEDPQVLVDAKDRLRHLHMANPTGRVFPLKWEEYDYTAFFATLRGLGYARRISVEASSKDIPKEGPLAIALLRGAFVK